MEGLGAPSCTQASPLLSRRPSPPSPCTGGSGARPPLSLQASAASTSLLQVQVSPLTVHEWPSPDRGRFLLVFTGEETEAGGHVPVWGHTLASGRAWAGAQVSMTLMPMGAASNRLLALVCPWPLLVQGRAHSLLATPPRRLCLQSVTKEMRQSQRSSQMAGHRFLSLLDPHRQPLQLPALGRHACCVHPRALVFPCSRAHVCQAPAAGGPLRRPFPLDR